MWNRIPTGRCSGLSLSNGYRDRISCCGLRLLGDWLLGDWLLGDRLLGEL